MHVVTLRCFEPKSFVFTQNPFYLAITAFSLTHPDLELAAAYSLEFAVVL